MATAPIVPAIPGYYSSIKAVQESKGLHTRWSGVRHYSRDEGIALMPICGPSGTPAKIVNVCAAFGAMAFEWVATRINAIPLLPSKTPPNPANEIFRGKSVALPNEGLMPDGATRVITIAGVYWYYLLLPPDEDYTIPVPAYDNSPPVTINKANFVYKPETGAVVPPSIPPLRAFF